MSEIPFIQWFPGHMTKTRRLMEKCLPLVDIIIEIRDARIPVSSKNPEIEKLVADKPRVIILSKCDTADENMNRIWCDYLNSNNVRALTADCKSGKGLKMFMPTVNEVLKDLIARRNLKGMVGRPIRMMIVGIPNVGKSSFINKLAGNRKAKVEDRPGVTRGKQWIKVENGAELLDMPGVLWPKFEDPKVGMHLAFTGAVKDDILDLEALASNLLEILNRDYKKMFCTRYNLTDTDDLTGIELLKLVGSKRGMLIQGGEVNTERAAIMVLDEFRGGKIGRITLEKPPAK